MSGRKVKAAEKYWFAIGYACGLKRDYEPPIQTVCDIAMEYGLDIKKEYDEGWKHGVSDSVLLEENNVN